MNRFVPTPLSDLSEAAWVVQRMPTFEGRAGQLLPGPYDAYARIFHRPDQGVPDEHEPVLWKSWASVAAERGTTLHEAAQWDYLAGHTTASPALGDPSRDSHPLLGSLDRSTLPVVRDVLAAHTSTPDACYLARWVGHGNHAPGWDSAPTFRLPGREYWLFASALENLVDNCAAFCTADRHDGDRWIAIERGWGTVESPQLWWPADRAWAVASEIDYDSTVVGGSVDLVEALLAEPAVECLRISPDTSLYFDADLVNRKPRS